MLKRALLLFIFSILCVATYAQEKEMQKVSGIVKIKNGKLAENINVSLKGTPYGSITNENGYFEFEAPAGKYYLTLQSINCYSNEYNINISKNRENYYPNLVVESNQHQLEEIVVTGQFSPQSLRNSLYKVKVINNKTIQQKAATDIQSLLNTEIGIRIANDLTLGESNFELMGMNGNNVKILLDGVPLIDRGSVKQSLSQIDVNNIEQIEIVEGPMSVIYGTDALAGVVNIISKKNNIYTDRNSYSISANVQEESVGDEYKFLDGKGIHNENIAANWASTFGLYANGSYTRNTNGGWKGEKTGREKFWPPKNQFFYEGLVGFKKENFNVWYRLNYLHENIFNPSNPSENDPYIIADKTFKTNRYTHILQGDWSIKENLGINMSSSLQDYKRKTRTIVTDLENSEKWYSNEEGAQDESNYKSAFIRTTATWKTNSSLSFQPGIEYVWDKGSGERIDGNRTISTLSLFLSAEWKPCTNASLRPGLRTNLNSDYDAPFAIPSLNTKYTVNPNFDIRASYAYGFRAPTLQELYFSFHDASHNIEGNPDLKAEYSHNFSGSAVWRWFNKNDIRITSTLSLFYNNFRDRITLAVSAEDPTQNTYYNISKYRTVGGTFENSVLWKDLQATLNVALIGRYNEFSDDSKYKDENMSKYKYSPEISSNINYFLRKTKTNFSLFYKFTGTRRQYNYNTTGDGGLHLGKLGSYNTADLTISQNIKKYFIVNAGIKNIFDVTTIKNTIKEDYHDFADSKDSLLGYGRSYFVGVRFLFNN